MTFFLLNISRTIYPLNCPSSNKLIFEIELILLLLGIHSNPGFDGLNKSDFSKQPASEAQGTSWSAHLYIYVLSIIVPPCPFGKSVS